MPLVLYNHRGEHVATRDGTGDTPLRRGDLIMARNPALDDELRLWQVVSVVHDLDHAPSEPIVTAWEKEEPKDEERYFNSAISSAESAR